VTHPRTARLTDPELPEVGHLLGQPIPAAIEALVGGTGGEVVSCVVEGVTWWPGRSITVRYQTQIAGGERPGGAVLVATAGRIPEGATVAEGEGLRVGGWRFPDDPALPGLPSALDASRVSDLLVDLGSEPHPVRTRLRAYRPARRAVVEAKAGTRDIYLKVIRPARVEALHQAHRALTGVIPTPASLGLDPDLGIVALQAMPGVTLRQALESPNAVLPSPTRIASLTDLPRPVTQKVTPSAMDRAPEMSNLLGAITPELRMRLEDIITRIGDDEAPADHPVHGDFYESQLMVTDGEIVGILDVDTYGWGRRGDDAATMLGHLSVWAQLSRQPDRVNRFAGDLLAAWDRVLDPVDLRIRTAAVVLSLCPGPFRVQSAMWPSETADRVALVERWLLSATRVDGR
jgi:hypothetical protein